MLIMTQEVAVQGHPPLDFSALSLADLSDEQSQLRLALLEKHSTILQLGYTSLAEHENPLVDNAPV